MELEGELGKGVFVSPVVLALTHQLTCSKLDSVSVKEGEWGSAS